MEGPSGGTGLGRRVSDISWEAQVKVIEMLLSRGRPDRSLSGIVEKIRLEKMGGSAMIME